MKTYRVEAQYITYVYVDIEAEDADQAWEIASDMDGGDFKESGFGDWGITNVEELK